MKTNELKTTGYDIDYESPNGIDNCMTINDYLHEELYNEYIDDPCLLLHLHYLNVYQIDYPRSSLGHPDIFKAAEQAFTPVQVIALYHYSNFDAKRSNCPIERKSKIIKALEDSDNLLEYKITDVLEFQEKIRWMPPIFFQDFTNILCRSGIMRYMCPEDNDILRPFERRFNYAKKNGFQEGRIDSYNSYTILECSNPNLISTGSKFVEESVSKLGKTHSHQSHFISETITMDEELIALSKKHPEDVFTGIRYRIQYSWERLVYFFEYRNGNCMEVTRKPGYEFYFHEDRIPDNEEFSAFKDYVIQRLNGIEIKKLEDEGFLLEKLADVTEQQSYESYNKIVYESEQYIWTARECRISDILVSVEKKKPEIGNPLELDD